MKTKQQVLAHLESLKSYAIEQGKDSTKVTALLAPLETAINGYYSVDIAKNVEKAIEAITHGLVRTGIVYADGSSDANDNQEPPGYNDVTVFFVNANKQMTLTTKEAFNASINEVTPEVPTEVTAPETQYDSNLVNSLTAEYIANATGVIEYLKAIAAYGNSAGLGNPLQKLLEPKEIKSVPSMGAISRDIYISRKYKDLIEFQGLNIYVPASLGGEANA